MGLRPSQIVAVIAVALAAASGCDRNHADEGQLAGTVHVGDAAPDFSLTKLDKSGTVTLSNLNRTQAVVMIFGSYT